MAEIKRTEKRMVEQEFVVEHVVTCDICGVKAKDPRNAYGVSWEDAGYGFDLVSIGTRVGSSYPEGGGYEEEHFDICTRCYTEKVKPFLESLGCKARKGMVDW